MHSGDWNKTATQVSKVQRPHQEVLPRPHCRLDLGVSILTEVQPEGMRAGFRQQKVRKIDRWKGLQVR